MTCAFAQSIDNNNTSNGELFYLSPLFEPEALNTVNAAVKELYTRDIGKATITVLMLADTFTYIETAQNEGEEIDVDVANLQTALNNNTYIGLTDDGVYIAGCYFDDILIVCRYYPEIYAQIFHICRINSDPEPFLLYFMSDFCNEEFYLNTTDNIHQALEVLLGGE